MTFKYHAASLYSNYRPSAEDSVEECKRVLSLQKQAIIVTEGSLGPCSDRLQRPLKSALERLNRTEDL